jgi:hypothetical protein
MDIPTPEQFRPRTKGNKRPVTRVRKNSSKLEKGDRVAGILAKYQEQVGKHRKRVASANKSNSVTLRKYEKKLRRMDPEEQKKHTKLPRVKLPMRNSARLMLKKIGVANVDRKNNQLNKMQFERNRPFFPSNRYNLALEKAVKNLEKAEELAKIKTEAAALRRQQEHEAAKSLSGEQKAEKINRADQEYAQTIQHWTKQIRIYTLKAEEARRKFEIYALGLNKPSRMPEEVQQLIRRSTRRRNVLEGKYSKTHTNTARRDLRIDPKLGVIKLSERFAKELRPKNPWSSFVQVTSEKMGMKMADFLDQYKNNKTFRGQMKQQFENYKNENFNMTQEQKAEASKQRAIAKKNYQHLRREYLKTNKEISPEKDEEFKNRATTASQQLKLLHQPRINHRALATAVFSLIFKKEFFKHDRYIVGAKEYEPYILALQFLYTPQVLKKAIQTRTFKETLPRLGIYIETDEFQEKRKAHVTRVQAKKSELKQKSEQAQLAKERKQKELEQLVKTDFATLRADRLRQLEQLSAKRKAQPKKPRKSRKSAGANNDALSVLEQLDRSNAENDAVNALVQLGQ